MVDSATVTKGLDHATLDLIWEAQRNEITEHVVYMRLAERVRDQHNRQVLERIGRDELVHHDFFAGYISVAKDLEFWPRFFEMALISLGVAAVSFALGWVVRLVFGLEA